MLRKTLVCLDGSKLAEEVIPYLFEACPESGAEVDLLHVISADITIPPPESIHAFTVGRDAKPVRTRATDIGKTDTLEPEAGSQLKEIEREQLAATRHLEGIAQKFHQKGIKIRKVILSGDPGPVILEYARNQNASLIALTTHGSGGLKGNLLGRVAQFVIKESDVPVMIIKPGKSERK
jgi:nucleotide-binding universal stress UspA family protein